MTQKNPIPKEVINVVETLEKAGFQAYLVGGCVRDILCGRIPKDWDITTNAKPETIQKLFPKTVYENSYGTVAIIDETTQDNSLKSIEVTPYRVEYDYSDNRHPNKVVFSEKIEEDLKRRDFTINAIAINLSKGAIKDVIDLYGGINDIKDKVIKAVGNPYDRFKEDALRMIRAIRFCVELDSVIDQETFLAIKEHNKLIKDISFERVRDEFNKIIMSPMPKKGIELLHDSGILSQIIPELEKCIGIEQNQAHAYDVWEHLLRSLQHGADKEYPLETRLAALFHDISKPETRRVSRETKQFTFYGHEVLGSRETRKILEKLKYSQAIIQKVTKLVRWHMFFSDTETITLSAVRRMIANVGKDIIWDLMNVRICDRIGTGRPKENPYRLRKYKAMIEEALRDPISVSMLKIDGAKIMKTCSIPPGPQVGFILHALFDEVLNNPYLNNIEYLEKRARELAFLPIKQLKQIGERGVERKRKEEEKEIEKIRNKHWIK